MVDDDDEDVYEDVDICKMLRKACLRFVRRFPVPEEAALKAFLVLVVQYDELGHLFVYHHEYHHRNRCNDDDEKAEAKVSKSQQKSAKVSKSQQK